jgi:hypothetical protein
MAYDHFMTPPLLISRVKEFFSGSIDLDPASNFVAQQYVQARTFCVDPNLVNSEEVPHNCYLDGLQLDWDHYEKIFSNPPYSAGNIDRFVTKLVDTTQYSYRDHEVLWLVQSSTDAGWFHMLLEHMNAVLFFRGRPKFWKIDLEKGEAYEKWVGKIRAKRGETKAHNAPMGRYCMFYFGANWIEFHNHFSDLGTIIPLDNVRMYNV